MKTIHNRTDSIEYNGEIRHRRHAKVSEKRNPCVRSKPAIFLDTSVYTIQNSTPSFLRLVSIVTGIFLLLAIGFFLCLCRRKGRLSRPV